MKDFNWIYFCMQFMPVKTRLFLPPKDDIWTLFDTSFPWLENGDLLFISSKILAIHQWRCVKIGTAEKKSLIEKESEKYLINEHIPWGLYLTITNNTLIPSAGIDESNANGYYILLPKDYQEEVKKLHTCLLKKYQINQLWIIITDTTSRPLRYGTAGIALYSYGFYPLIDKRGEQDLFGKTMELTQINLPESLSSFAVFLMGETNEQTPMLIARGMPHIHYTVEDLYPQTIVPIDQDIYAPLLKNFL